MPRSQLFPARGLIALAPAAALALALVGCGGTLPEAGAPPEAPAGEPPAATAERPPDTSGSVETAGTEPATTSSVTESPPSAELRPPPIVLESAAGRQEAVQGSYCLTRVNQMGEGEGVCADSSFPHPEQLSVMRPHGKISIELSSAAVVDTPEGCSPACASTVTVYPLGCGPERPVAAFQLTGAKTAWALQIEPGAYELAVFAYFEAEDGATGDTSGVVGLVVDPDRRPAVIPVDEALAVCALPQQT